MRYISKSLLLLGLSVMICCIVYPLVVWAIGQTFFPFTSNGSIVNGPDGKPVGSLLIAQPFTKDEYFQPRPSAASYDASASASSTLSASNYMLRNRVAQQLGPIVKYKSGPKAGQLVAPDIEAWFDQDSFGGQPHIVAQWADAHNAVAQAWVSADPTHDKYIQDWGKTHTKEVQQFIKDNPGTPEPKSADLAMVFFESFSKENPGKFPSTVQHQTKDGKTESCSRAGQGRLRHPVELLRYVAAGTCGRRPSGRAGRHGHGFGLRPGSQHHDAECGVPA